MNEKDLREQIGDLAYEVTQNAATERPFSGEYDDDYEDIHDPCLRFQR